MTIQDIASQIKTIQTKWLAVVTSRPGEDVAVKTFFGASTNYAAISSQIRSWSEQIDRVAARPRISRSISKPLIASASRSLFGMSRSLDHVGNGVEWVFVNAGFGQLFLITDYLISQLVKDSAREEVVVLDAAQARLASDIKGLQDGADIANKISTAWPDIEKQLEQLETASESATETLATLEKNVTETKTAFQTQAEEATEAISENRDNVLEAKATFDVALGTTRESLDEAESIKSTAQTLLKDISEKSSAVEKKLMLSEEALEKATSQQIATRERLTLALRDAQMEGLAGSFTRMAQETSQASASEQKRFELALVYLAVVGVLALLVELIYGGPKTVDEFSFRLVRMLSIATPGIWIAWLASRKLGALQRVFSDYQYKSAAALAYESYRQAVDKAESTELKQQLLAFAIHSFGVNPTQYYDSAKNEASSPMEAWIEKIPFLKREHKP